MPSAPRRAELPKRPKRTPADDLTPRHDIGLGIDLGTSAMKIAAFELQSGRRLAAVRAPLAVQSGADGRREQDPAEIIRVLGRAASELRRRLGRRWGRIAGVGLAAQGGSAILADRLSGSPLTIMQLWNDTRPYGLLPAIARRRGRGYWRRLSLLDAPGAGLARIQWLRRHQPFAFGRNSIYVGAGEFVFFHLTGQWRQDAGNALQIGCYDVPQQRLVAQPLRLVGANLDFVAPLRAGHEKLSLSARGSQLLRLPAGIPVAGPYMDHEAGYLACAGLSKHPMQCSLGTAWVANFVLPGDSPPGGALNLVLPNPLGRGRMVVRVMRAGSATWDWACRAAAVKKGPAAIVQAQQSLRDGMPPPVGLVALPWLTQPGPWGLSSGGGILGITTETSRADLLRAIAAGMCFELKAVVAPAIQAGNIDAVVLTGGASRSKYFQRFLAGLLAPTPVYVLKEEFFGCRGAVRAFLHRGNPPRVDRVPGARPSVQTAIDHGYKVYCRTVNSLAAACRREAAGFLEDVAQRSRL